MSDPRSSRTEAHPADPSGLAGRPLGASCQLCDWGPGRCLDAGVRGQAWLGWHCHHTPCRSSVSTGGTAQALDGRRPHAESDGPPQNTAVRVREDGAPTLRALASRPGPGAGRSPGAWKRQPAGEPQSWGAGDREAPVTSHSRGPASCGAVMGYMGTKQACKTLCPGPARWARLPPPPLPRTVRTAPCLPYLQLQGPSPSPQRGAPSPSEGLARHP